jgi:excisionase family DNA binding protein
MVKAEQAPPLFVSDPDETALVDVATAVQDLRVCERTIRSMVAKGELEHVRIGRRVLFTRAALRRFIESATVGARVAG